MDHCGTQTIETERLILRRFEPDDAKAMYINWASDPEVTKYLTWPTHSSIEVSRKIITDWVSRYVNDDVYLWAIVPKDFGEPVGSIAAVKVDNDLSMVHIGYCIGRKFWHKGITSEALKAVTDFFFDKVGANRVEARHDPNNPNSGKVMKKAGLLYEGTMRQADRNNQGIVDMACYGLLRSDRQ